MKLRVHGRPAALLLAVLALAGGLPGCRGGYETETLRREGIREWFFPMEGGRVEALAVWPVNAEGPVPALLLVHGDRDSAQTFRRSMFSLARAGVYAMSVSLPGFGESTGPEDFGGPRSVRAILLAVDYLAKQPEARTGGLAIYGEGMGAAPALAAAAQDPRIRLAAAEEPIADLAESFPRLSDAQRGRLLRTAGGAPPGRPEAYKERSAREWAARLQVPLLVIHSPRNRVTPLAQAEALVQAARRNGQPGQLRTLQRQSQELDPRRPSLARWVLPFMRQHLPREVPLRRAP